jgi:predicted pyridoxine 5'-phosphate oxidase superfamily flavin-nucleotide-binding protein
MINEDMRAIIEAQHLCFAATVSLDVRPNLSPKATIRVWDEKHLFCDIASPNTRSNLEKKAWIELTSMGCARCGETAARRLKTNLKGTLHNVARSDLTSECVAMQTHGGYRR